MKRMKKLASLLLALVMVFSMTITASADETTGGRTITITNEKSGHTYEAYQVFAGTISDGKLVDIQWGSGVDGVALLTALKADKTLGDLFENVTGIYAAEKIAEIISKDDFTSEQLDRFAEIVGDNLSDTVAGTSTQSKEDDTYTYTISGLADGYYIVKDKKDTVTADGDAYTKYILSVFRNVEITAKADAPTVDKKIVEGTERVDANNGSIGDTVEFEVKSKVPEMDGYEKYFFIVHDTFSKGLEYTEGTVEIKIGDSNLNDSTYYTEQDDLPEGKSVGDVKETKDYYVKSTKNIDGTTDLEIVFVNFLKYKEKANADIVITYSAVIDDDAVIGNAGNPNVVYLEYSNNPNVVPGGENEPDDDDVTGETPDAVTITYVTGIKLIKVDENGDQLAGAEFKITGKKLNKVKIIKEEFVLDSEGTWYKLKDGTYTETVPYEEIADNYESTIYTYKLVENVYWNTETVIVSATETVGIDGILTFDGLGEGTYVITEIKAPAGYNKLKDTITVVITCKEPEIATTGEETAEWSYGLSGAVTADTSISADGRVHITIENKPGTVLPETGGIGTTVFYVLGSILLLAAAILLITRKRMNTER